MFIFVIYKDAPELSIQARRNSSETDTAVEKTLLVNPDCPVRIMLEYIRKKCRLGIFTHFDLCDESGSLMGLFALQTYSYATDEFEHKKTYYLIVMKPENEKADKVSVIPQLNRENRLYLELKTKVKKYLMSDEVSPPGITPPPAPPVPTKASTATTKSKSKSPTKKPK